MSEKSVATTILSDSEIFSKAADLLETHGLADGTRIDHDGSMCILGPWIWQSGTILRLALSIVILLTVGFSKGWLRS